MTPTRPIEDYRDMIAQTMITSVVTRACAELIEAIMSEPDLNRRVVLAEATMGQIARALMESWPGGAVGFAAAAEAAA